MHVAADARRGTGSHSRYLACDDVATDLSAAGRTHMFRRRMAPSHDSTLIADAADAERQRARTVLNRFIFRGMLFSMGSIAVVLHRVLPWKSVAWEFAKISARNLARACGVHVRVHGLEHLTGPGPYIFAPNHQSHFDIPALLGYLPGHN